MVKLVDNNSMFGAMSALKYDNPITKSEGYK